MNKLVQVQEGNTLQDLPQGATVTATLDTNSIRSGKEETKSVEATINFGENRTQKINLTYKVLNTFPIARTIYDFKNPDTARQGGSSAYYHNGGTIPDGMTWIYKGNDKVTKPGDEFTAALANDLVGTTTNYEFGGKYNYGRFTNSPTTTGNLEYTERVVHKVFDIADSAAVTVSKGATLTIDQAKAAVKKADGSDPLPEGTTYEWVESTDTNTPGKRTYKVKVTLPVSQSGSDAQPVATQARPSKTINVTVKVKPTAPTVTPKDNGDVLITPTNETNVDKVSVTFTPQEGTNPAEVTYTAKKNASGVWEFGSGAPLTVDPTTGVFRLKDRVVKDGSTVTAKALTTDGTGSVQSNPTTGIAGNGDAVLPEIEFKNTEIDAQGNRVVYITPTETTNVEVATVKDNSNKLLEAVFYSGDTTPAIHLGNYGLTYNEVIRNGDTITNAPYTLTVTGTLNKFRSGSTLWNDGDVIVTRYASAMDAAENNIREKSGSRTDSTSNPYRVVFKVRTQATKYTPTANTLTRNDQAPKHTEAQVTGAVTGEKITGKRVVGEIPEGTGEATVEVTYEDGSKENVKVQITVTPSDATTVTPTVTPLTRHDQAPKHTEAQVTGAVTGEKITGKRVVGEIPEGTGEATVEVTYEDGSKENVKVQITVTPSDATTVTPTVTPVVRDDQHKPNNDDVTAAVTLPEGTTGKSITNKEVVGNVPTEVGGPTNVVVKVTYGDGSTENVDVPVLVVGLPSKTPAKDKAHLTPEEKKQVEDKVKAKNPGKKVTVGDDGTATVTDPTTGISHTIPGTDLVNQDFEPVIPADKIPVKDPDNLTQEEQDKVKESVEKANPGKKVTVDKTGKVTITDPNTNISHEIPGEKLITLDPPVVVIPEYTEPIGTTGVDGNGNLLAPPIVNLPELIITKWTDEAGKELKAADAKAPKVLGEANEALEAGEIAGYEFVRTETKDDVVTHIFRKVTPIKLEGNANNQSTSTAKVEKSTKRLANTGEAETNTGLAGLGLAALGSLLAVAKRRKKDEE